MLNDGKSKVTRFVSLKSDPPSGLITLIVFGSFCIHLLQLKGEAEAFAIEEKAKAEAEQMAKKADAWKDYQDAAMVDMVLDVLPKVGQIVPATIP